MKINLGMLFCILISYASFSQEKKKEAVDSIVPKINYLSEILVTGDNITDPVMLIESNNYAEKIVQPRNVADLFKDLNGFSLIKRGNYAIDPSFRASQYEQLNVQFDGGTKVMNACPNRMDPITTHVIPEEIEKIEVIKGPYTVRYGATFGGIVNMVTQKPIYSNSGLHGSVHSGFETNGNSLVSMLKLQQVSRDFDITGNMGYRNFGDYKDGNGTEIPSSFKSLDYGLKLGYNFSANQRLQAHWRQSFGRDILHAGLPMDSNEDNSSVLALDYQLSTEKGSLKALNVKAYYAYVDHLMSNTNRPSFMMTDAVSDVDATTIGGKAELKWVPTSRLTLYMGIDAFTIARDGDRTRTVKRNMMTGEPLEMPMVFHDKIWQDSQINDFGAFAEAKYAVSDQAVLTTGLRYDLVLSEIGDPAEDFKALYPNLDNRTENNFSATISLKQELGQNHVLELAYGRGVRSASMIERYINHATVGQDGYEYVGNPDLDAEINNQFEIGITGNQQLGRGIFNTVEYGFSTYYAFYENYMMPVIDPSLQKKFMPNEQPTAVKRFVNLDKAYKTGFEVFGDISFLDFFNFKTELAYVYTKNKDLDEHLPFTPPLVTRFYLGMEKEKFWTNIQYTITSKQEDIAPSFGEQETAGYGLVDFRFGMQPLRNTVLGLAVLNVFDQNYHNHLNFSYTNQAAFERVPIKDPGRNFTVFLQYKF